MVLSQHTHCVKKLIEQFHIDHGVQSLWDLRERLREMWFTGLCSAVQLLKQQFV